MSKWSVDDALLCPISLDLMREATTVEPCGHVFDLSTIEAWQHNPNNHDNSCPLCRSSIVALVPNTSIKAQVQAFSEGLVAQLRAGQSQEVIDFLQTQKMLEDPLNQQQDTAYHVLAETGQTQALTSVLKQITHKDRQNAAGMTALMLAAQAGHVDTVRLLLPQCDVRQRNHRGQTAFMLAERGHHQAVCGVFRPLSRRRASFYTWMYTDPAPVKQVRQVEWAARGRQAEEDLPDCPRHRMRSGRESRRAKCQEIDAWRHAELAEQARQVERTTQALRRSGDIASTVASIAGFIALAVGMMTVGSMLANYQLYHQIVLTATSGIMGLSTGIIAGLATAIALSALLAWGGCAIRRRQLSKLTVLGHSTGPREAQSRAPLVGG